MARLRQALAAAEADFRAKLPMMRAVVVAVDGDVLWESYVAGTERDLIWDGSGNGELPLGPRFAVEATPDHLHSVKSVTKSILALVTGIALERGLLESLDIEVGAVLDDAGDKSGIRLRDLLAMRSGLEWEENGQITIDYIESGDALRFTLERQAVLYEPGAVAEYSTADSHLLGCCVAAAAGRPLEQLAEELLFKPLGIERYRWLRDATGTVIGGSELYLRPRDMASIGLMVLRGGDDIVSPEWLHYVTTAQPDIDPVAWSRGGPVSLVRTGYAHHWWRGRAGGRDVRFAQGLGGQTIQIYDDPGAVIATTTNVWRDFEADPVPEPSLWLADRHLVPALTQ